MTQLEMIFMETVPALLERIADALEKLAEVKTAEYNDSHINKM